jgi:tripartite-type tricarboxylate transporter receptor subunit TctC
MLSPSKALAATLVFLAAAMIVSVTGEAISATAQSSKSFYSGKDLKFIIADGVGGGYDAYSRLLARHLADHIPGKPQIVPENMPGAAGLVATNWLY